MNEKLVALITEATRARKVFEKARKKFPFWKLEDAEYADMIDAEQALARWVIKNTDKLRSVE